MSNEKLTPQQRLDKYIVDNYGKSGLSTIAENYFSIQNESRLHTTLERLENIERRYQEVEKKYKQLKDPKEYVRQQNLQRQKIAKETREKRKLQQEERRQERQQAWELHKDDNIIFLGGEKNNWLYIQPKPNHEKRLRDFGLPIIKTPQELASLLNLSIRELQFLCYHRTLSTHKTYLHFQIPKKTGGFREISEPLPILKKAQHWIVENILYLIPQLDCVHGFVPNRSILTNALPHVQKEIVMNMDIQDFFPSVTHQKVLQLFRRYGYPHAVALCLTRLCTEQSYQKISLDGQIKYLSQGPRTLPQGAPTSPVISNLILRNLDLYIQSLAREHQLEYTRYADDLTLSSSNSNCKVGSILEKIRQRTKREGFCIHPQKTRVMRKSSRQEVTGVVVNEKPNIDRETLLKFRAFLHCLDKKGPQKAYWNGSARLFDKAFGFASFVTMIDANKGNALMKRVRKIASKHIK